MDAQKTFSLSPENQMESRIANLCTAPAPFFKSKRFVPTPPLDVPSTPTHTTFAQYAANLWVWSTPRPGYPGSPKKGQDDSSTTADVVTATSPGRILATFRNQGSDPTLNEAQLYYFDGRSDSLWGELSPNDPPISVNTFKGHVWRVKVGDTVRHTWKIEQELPEVREFVV